MEPEVLTSPLQNEDPMNLDPMKLESNDVNVLYAENTADSKRLSTCSKASTSVQGHDVLEEEALYIAGNEPERKNSTASPPDITNKHHHNAENDDNPIPAPDVYVVSDKINAEDSAMYTASEENEESNPKVGSIDEEEKAKVKHGDSTAAMNLNSKRNANRPQPDTKEDDAKNQTWQDELSEDIDIEPYAVADMCDHETYLGTAASKAPQTTGLSDTGKTCSDPGAQEPQDPNNKQFPNPMYGTNVRQRASEDSGVHKLQNPPNVDQIKTNPIYDNDPQQASAIIAGVVTGVSHNTQVQTASPTQDINSWSTFNVTEPTSTIIAVITSSDGTNETIFEGIHGTDPSNVGSSHGTNNPPTLESVEQTACEGKTMELSCAADKLLVIDDAFYGRRTKKGCGCHWLLLKGCNKCEKTDNSPDAVSPHADVRLTCQGVQQCSEKVTKMNFRDPCPGTKKYLEVSYHCEEKGQRVTFGGKGKGPGQFRTPRGLTVSSTNEIFVTDVHNKRIQVFSMEGVFLRSFLTENMEPQDISADRNDSLWSVTVDKKGNIFIADMVNHRVLKYDKNGVYLSSFGSRGAGAGNLFNPSGICVDSLGRVIVADSWNRRVEMFTAEGDHVRTIAYIHDPEHVAAGGEGQLVVSHQDHFVTIFPKY
ncbi:TRIM71 [Branchiostoma lanceolatum]|uniref:TRIM71 protein n=1 Tax=Branchiostoma lanceolatum TaxID=7740 RepID=A0A8K0EIN5_BRALA|nr:TRIM71 [Branchiostoma lanceolatum]